MTSSPQGFKPCQCPPAQQQAAGSTVQEQQRDTFQHNGSLSQPTRENPVHPYSGISLADTRVTSGPHPHSNPLNRGHPSDLCSQHSVWGKCIRNAIKAGRPCPLVASKAELQPHTSSGSSLPPAPLPLFLAQDGSPR